MIKKINITNRATAQKVLQIQIPSYKIEASIIGFDDLPPLKDTVESLQHCAETFYGYFQEEELAGVISFKTTDSVLDIHRLMVHPAHFRKGIAHKLISLVEKLGKGREIVVTTGAKNIPAINFYKKHGFIEIQKIDISDHLTLTQFKKASQINKQ